MDDLKKYEVVKKGVIPTDHLKIKLSEKLAAPYVKKGVLKPVTKGRKPKAETKEE